MSSATPTSRRSPLANAVMFMRAAEPRPERVGALDHGSAQLPFGAQAGQRGGGEVDRSAWACSAGRSTVRRQPAERGGERDAIRNAGSRRACARRSAIMPNCGPGRPTAVGTSAAPARTSCRRAPSPWRWTVGRGQPQVRCRLAPTPRGRHRAQRPRRRPAGRCGCRRGPRRPTGPRRPRTPRSRSGASDAAAASPRAPPVTSSWRDTELATSSARCPPRTAVSTGSKSRAVLTPSTRRRTAFGTSMVRVKAPGGRSPSGRRSPSPRRARRARAPDGLAVRRVRRGAGRAAGCRRCRR